MKISKTRIMYETPEHVAVSMPKRSRYAGYVGMIEKRKCIFEDEDITVQLGRSVLLKPFEDRCREQTEIPADEFIREAM